MAMRNKMSNAKKPKAWNGKPAIELEFVLEVNNETRGLTLPSEWNCIMLNTPCMAAKQNVVTPKCRRLYNKGMNFLFSLVNGPILNIICNKRTARVEVERIRTVSNV